MEFWKTTEKEGNLEAKCEYNTETEEYTVSVWRENEKGIAKTKSWTREGFQPRFGMDHVDYAKSFAVAEELSIEFDKENKE